MATEQLEALVSLEFDARIVASTPTALRLLLLRAPEVESLRSAYDSGEVTNGQIRRFVGRLLREYASSASFPHQTALAALAVALESRFTDLAREYLRDLARVRLDRFRLASGVARICLKRHSEHAQNTARTFRIGEDLRDGVLVYDLSAAKPTFSPVSVSRHVIAVSYG